ncbi:pseudouridine synthase [Suicoccus acidiformans]|uniref:Pseudouridine synthase n=1 Tax=Suicoccus acidiformans TaxID=2036206 RepID=A0A347WL94_9LACT|nr:pseudouridine synthase [Suicoccus acidiformans]AXY25851.1 pseudouridine synthase [Suicoccus acidiformans]
MERLQKVMAHAGVASRRKCEEIIQAGRVKVNGEVVRELGTKVSREDTIEVDGVPIYKEEPRYILLYKPRNVISAVSDDKERPVVTDYVQGIPERIYPIGRLDFDTTGLLMMTNDGDFANLMMHPRYKINKTYIAKIDGFLAEADMQNLRRGVMLDKQRTAPAKVRVLSTNDRKQMSVVELTIREGWNHQVKRMFEAVGRTVVSLKRERFSFLDLGNLQPGQWRELTAFEVDKLRKEAESAIK